MAFQSEITAQKVQLVLATSDEPDNKEFEALLNALPVTVFYGAVNNIPFRLLQCARAYDFQNIISIDGDDVLCSPQAAKQVCEKLHNTDSTRWFKTVGLALGMNVAGYKRSVLETSEKQIGIAKLETGWGRVFDTLECSSIRMGDYESRQDLRFTLDYEEDVRFFKSIIEALGEKIFEYSDEQIINFTLKNGLNNINRDVNNRYWTNFNDQIKIENS